MTTPEEFGRDYATATYTLLKETDDVRFRAWDKGRPLEQPDDANSEIQRELDAAHEHATAAHISVRQHAQTIADLPADSQADALRAMHTHFDETLRADIADTIRRCRERFPGCNHIGHEHHPCGLGVDADIEPLNAESIRKIHDWLHEQKPKYIGHHLEFEVSGAIWLLNSIDGDLDHKPHPDPVAATTTQSRENTAESITYLNDTLVQLDGNGKVIATYDGTQAAKALKAFRAHIEKEFGQRIHNTKHQLTPGPFKPCDSWACYGRNKDPWS